MRRAHLISLLLLGCATTAPATAPGPEPKKADAFRNDRPPALERAETFAAPVPVDRTLRNGLRILVYENHALPLVSAELLIFTGIDGETPAQAGLAGLTARMLTEGTRRKTAIQLAEALEDLAIHLSASAESDHMSVSLDSLSETLPQALDLLAEVIQEPAFRPGDFKRVQNLALTALEQKRGNPDALAADVLGERLYGKNHPWGQPSGGTPETVKRLRASMLATFHKTYFKPNHAVLSVAGDVSPDLLVTMLEARVGRWKAGVVRPPRLPEFPELAQRSISLVDQPHSTQSFVWIGGHAIPARHPDALALRLANFALGGLFSSRLNANLREAKGYSYGYFSRLSLERDAGAWIASGPIKAEDTAPALAEVEQELERFARGDVTDPELSQAKLALVRGLPVALETNGAVASALARLVLVGLPLDYYKTLADQTARISRDDVARVAKTYLQPERWPVSVAGPRERVEKPVAALDLGTVTVETLR